MTALFIILSICSYIVIAKVINDVGIEKDFIDNSDFIYPLHVILWPVFIVIYPLLKIGERIAKFLLS